MAGYLLDTNHVSLIARAEAARKRLDRERKDGVKVGVCVPVLCEIEGGLRSASNPAALRPAVHKAMRGVRVWPLSGRTSKIYGDIYRDLRRRGRVLSQVDMMVAALAIQMNATILTADRDFKALPDVRTEDWSVSLSR